MSSAAGSSKASSSARDPDEHEKDIKPMKKIIHSMTALQIHDKENAKILNDYPLAQYPVDVINKYSDWLQLSERNKKSLLDIGIDKGEIFLSLMDEKWLKNFKRVVGTSMSNQTITKLLNDKEQNKLPEILEFQLLNLDVMPINMRDKYDVITSFWHLDRFKNHKKIFRDIYNILEHNGVLLVVMVADCIVHELIRYMAAHENNMVEHDLPFTPAMLYPEQSPSAYKSYSVNKVSQYLAEAGFEAMCVEYEDVVFRYTTRTGFEARAKMLNQIRKHVELYKDAMFYDEIYEKLKDLGHVESAPKQQLRVSIPVKALNIVAKKRKSKIPKVVTMELLKKEEEEEKAKQGPYEKHVNIKVQPTPAPRRFSQITSTSAVSGLERPILENFVKILFRTMMFQVDLFISHGHKTHEEALRTNLTEPKVFKLAYNEKLKTEHFTDILQKYSSKLKIYEKNNASVIEIYCGKGDFLANHVRTSFPAGKVSQYVGITKSNKSLRRNIERYKDVLGEEECNLRFDHLNIERKDFETSLPDHGPHDYLISFWCMHLVRRQYRAFRNMFLLLKPGGCLIMSFVIKSLIFEIFQKLALNRTFKKYIRDVSAGISYYQNRLNPFSKLKEHLKNAGFDMDERELSVGLQEEYFHFDNEAELTIWLASINVFHYALPESIQDLFYFCCRTELTKRQYLSIDPDGEFMCVVPVDIVNVFARRPPEVTGVDYVQTILNDSFIQDIDEEEYLFMKPPISPPSFNSQ